MSKTEKKTETEPIPDTGAESAAKFIHKLSGTFGYPISFRWDNCPQFENHLIKALLALVGVERHPSIAYNPQSNGIVERAIQEVIRHLRFCVNERRSHEDWDQMLPLVTRIINSSKHSSIGLTPAEILLPGFNLDEHLYPVAEPKAVKETLDQIGDKKRKETVQQYVDHMIALQVQAIKTAKKFSSVLQHKIEGENITGGQQRVIQLGDWVVCKWRGGRPSKLTVTWRGPYRVNKKLSGSVYEVQDPVDLKTYKKHIRELYNYNLSSGQDPRDIIAMDEVEQLVDEIVEHNDQGSKRQTLWDFKVRWQGSTEEEDSWIPWSVARPLAALDKYSQAHPELGIKDNA